MQWSETYTIQFHILFQTQNGKGTQTIKTTYSKTTKAESQGVSSFPSDGHKAIIKLNK